jgi:hypothetical protein
VRGQDRAAVATAALLIVAWGALAAWLVPQAPFRSGTDESIDYVAFAAAENRWATEEDFRRYGLQYYYYGPLYFLAFAPFYGPDPAFVEGFPRTPYVNPLTLSGGRQTIAPGYLASVPPSVLRLYRHAKLASAACGLVVLVALLAGARLLARGAGEGASVLVAVAPVVLLPQFLYYQTLCNNDALVNALGALAVLAFVGAALGAGRRFVVLAVATAACCGLAVLTKLQGATLVPLLGGLLALEWSRTAGQPGPDRRRRLLALGASLGLVAFLAGGWWIARGAWHGDWDGFRAHRLAHPWAFVDRPLWETHGAIGLLAIVARTYFASFTGLAYGLPDGVFLVCLALAALPLGVLLVRWRAVRALLADPGPDRLVVLTLLATAGLNLALLLANCSRTLAPYGRLLFPSLLAWHLALAVLLRRAVEPRGRLVLAATLLAGYGAVFAWTLESRLLDAIRQGPEGLVPVTVTTAADVVLPIPAWKLQVDQGLQLPPGTLVGVRINTRRGALPILGGALEGRVQAGGSTMTLRRLAFADNDGGSRWTDLELERPLHLAEESAVTLHLSATAPWVAMTDFQYRLTEMANGSRARPAVVNGQPLAHALVLSAIYAEGR